jgi:hypothetical protein
MTATQLTITLVVVAVFVVIAVVGWLLVRRWSLRQRFGPEYDRLVAETGGRADAERELRQRQRHHAELNLKPISEDASARFAKRWDDVQVKFVDEPAAAVTDAAALVTELVAERGYPVDDYDQQLSDLSVEHAGSLSHYRDAHEIAERNARGEATTEQLRQAMVHYRALFADLIGARSAPSTPDPARQ